jgi:ferric-dicitrate binding protein FerR (iron transport regulator)
MSKKVNTVSKIIRLYFSNDYPESLKREVQDWLVDGTNETEKDEALRLLFDEFLENAPTSGRDAREALQRLEVDLGLVERTKKAVSLRRRFVWITAACIPMAIAVGICFSLLKEREPELQEPLPFVLNALSVANEPPEMAVLADGSSVWVNENSTVRYTEGRVALLTGEAYFEVKKEEGKPFRVQAGQLSITVRGTKFNVKAYPGVATTLVTLYEGEVLVQDSVSTYLMRPGEQLLYDNDTGVFTLSGVETVRPGWLLVRLNFDKLPLGEVFERIEWYYHVVIACDTRVDREQRVMLCLSGEEALGQVLFLLEQLCGDFAYEVVDDCVTVRAIDEKEGYNKEL